MSKSKIKAGDLVKSINSERVGLVLERPNCTTIGHGVWIQWIDLDCPHRTNQKQWIADCWLEIYDEQK